VQDANGVKPKRPWWPHWLRCHWTDWSTPKPGVHTFYRPWDGRTRELETMVQHRVCTVCKKVELREVA
jgi:hypothetical protein